MMIQNRGARVSDCFTGSLRITLPANGFHARDGRLFLSFEEKEEADLAPLAVPEGCLVLCGSFWTDPGPMTACKPEGGKVFFKGFLGRVRALIERKLGDENWRLETSREALKAEPGAEFGEIEPLLYCVQVDQTESDLRISTWLRDASGARCSLNVNGKPVDPPCLVLTDEGGNQVLSRKFTYGDASFFNPIQWKVPPELSGKVLKAELVAKQTAFKVVTMHCTFLG